jgi:hypothetical protein
MLNTDNIKCATVLFPESVNPAHSATQISSNYVLARYSNDAYVSQVSCSQRAFGQQFCMHFFFTLPVAGRSKAHFWGRLLAGIAGSNPAECMAVCHCECCVLSGRGLCDGPITRPEESYCVCVCVCMCVCVCVCEWVSLNATRCNNNPLHLQQVDRSQTKNLLYYTFMQDDPHSWSSLRYPHLTSSTNYGIPQYSIFSDLLLLPLSYFQMSYIFTAFMHSEFSPWTHNNKNDRTCILLSENYGK